MHQTGKLVLTESLTLALVVHDVIKGSPKNALYRLPGGLPKLLFLLLFTKVPYYLLPTYFPIYIENFPNYIENLHTLTKLGYYNLPSNCPQVQEVPSLLRASFCNIIDCPHLSTYLLMY